MDKEILYTIKDALISKRNLYRLKSMIKPEESEYWIGHMEETGAALDWINSLLEQIEEEPKTT